MVEYFDLINTVEAELIQMPGDRSLYKGGLTIDSLRFLIAVALNPNAMDAVTVRFTASPLCMTLLNNGRPVRNKIRGDPSPEW